MKTSSNANQVMNDLMEKMDIRMTYQRKIILSILIDNIDKHLTANEIYSLIKVKNDVIGMATIYRTIDILLDKGIVIKHDFGDSAAKYELEIEKNKNHHHLICKKCGKVIEVSGLLKEDFYEKILREKGFQCTEYRLKIFGYCDKCRS
ncbi:transcriptional repressor [Vallitalea longa]|uniref:Transcriptional repressor n=1 Tax=Vallitalea longa TaxID=2936439 RepID=A0A9W6DCW3_9FIRM|nr:transcriptional repressor [Vallitalea longa]GKX27526.1 transcriptional repressor [Vallitalea longa]